MKVKNIAFSGFMASILMAGAAYAADTPTLATDQYVIQGVNYAISQAAADAASKVGTAVTNITNGTTIAAKATGDADGNEISSTYLKATDAADTYEAKGTAAGLVGTLPTGKANVVAYIADESAAAENAIKALDDDLKELQETVAGIESYDDAELAGRVSANETAINTINTSDVMQSGATADKINAITSNTTAIGANASAIADLENGKQDQLDADQLAAVNSGIDADKVGKYDAYNTTLTELAADITELDRKKQDALPTTTGNTGKVLKVGANGLEWATDANSVYDDTALAGAIEGLDTDINAANTGLKARMTAAETSIINKANATDVYTKTEVDGLLDGKQTNLTTEQLAAANSGITDTKVSGYDSHVADDDIHVTSTEKSTWNAKQNAISDLETIRTNATAGKSASDTIATYGNIVTHNVVEFATAEQGAKADSALQNSCESGYCLVTPTGGMVSIKTVSENSQWGSTTGGSGTN